MYRAACRSGASEYKKCTKLDKELLTSFSIPSYCPRSFHVFDLKQFIIRRGEWYRFYDKNMFLGEIFLLLERVLRGVSEKKC